MSLSRSWRVCSGSLRGGGPGPRGRGGRRPGPANKLVAGAAPRVLLLCLVAPPRGGRRLEEISPSLDIFTASLDRELNDKKYILPGLGDFGDRLYGTF